MKQFSAQARRRMSQGGGFVLTNSGPTGLAPSLGRVKSEYFTYDARDRLTNQTQYVSGAVLSLMIWSIDEGFGGPYGPGATDIGAATMYVFLFVGFLIMARASNYGQ